ncbi:hypothetical protein B0H34DRAFT_40667 [Crassisporium funariophilum]|nr:hypothetical protein B0H34DRAFT_40667 [Crassisporium funariophilum]
MVVVSWIPMWKRSAKFKAERTQARVMLLVLSVYWGEETTPERSTDPKPRLKTISEPRKQSNQVSSERLQPRHQVFLSAMFCMSVPDEVTSSNEWVRGQPGLPPDASLTECGK